MTPLEVARRLVELTARRRQGADGTGAAVTPLEVARRLVELTARRRQGATAPAPP